MQGKTLVTYFSAEGTTAAVAKAIAAELNADIFEISTCEQGPVRKRRVFLRGELSAQSGHVQDRYLMGFL